jgi:hypothetical protein
MLDGCALAEGSVCGKNCCMIQGVWSIAWVVCKREL